MKIYTVMYFNGDGHDLVDIFSTRAKAEKYMRKIYAVLCKAKMECDYMDYSIKSRKLDKKKVNINLFG